jgi:branched-chain amino acid transport system ATP-binding protein
MENRKMILLKLENVNSGYGQLQVLWDISISVNKGEIVSVLGPNGAGKTTLLRTIMGLTTLYRGNIVFNGEEISKLPSHKRVELGIVLVPEGRQLFPHMTVYENLMMGSYSVGGKKTSKDTLEFVFNLFPILKARLKQKAGTLSGGEQQMLAIARALMSKPKILMLDEPSQGLAPKIVQEIFRVIKDLKKEGLGIILVEQYVKDALSISDRTYIIRGGRIVLEAESKDITAKEELIKHYLA